MANSHGRQSIISQLHTFVVLTFIRFDLNLQATQLDNGATCEEVMAPVI
jgi:hypothetical protein